MVAERRKNGFQAPVVCMAWGEEQHIASGDRSGNVLMWDLERGQPSQENNEAHHGHVTAMAWLPSMRSFLLNGGQVSKHFSCEVLLGSRHAFPTFLIKFREACYHESLLL